MDGLETCLSSRSREPSFLPLETVLAEKAGSQPMQTLSLLLGEAGSSCSLLTWERVSICGDPAESCSLREYRWQRN